MSLDLPGADTLLEALESSQPSVSVRPNHRRAWVPEGADGQIPWLPEAVYLPVRPQFTMMPQLHQGRFYVQDASSMFIAHAIRSILPDLESPVTYLDACAAPGGKTTVAVDTLPEGSLVVANEFDRRRASVLRENIVKWGSPSVIVTQGDTKRYARIKSMFDIVAVDAPCSGEGMFRKEPEALSQWSPALVEDCARLQTEILSNLWPSIKPGGYLIYSTCTFNRRENEDRVRWLVEEFGAEPVDIEIDDRWNILRSPVDREIPSYRFMPGVVRGEGLFMAVVRKPGRVSDEGAKKVKAKPKQEKRSTAVDIAARWINNPDDFDVTVNGDSVIAFPHAHARIARQISENCNVIHQGVTLATLKGRDLIPDHSLAMSTALCRGAFPEVELNENDALTYLRRDAVTLPESTPRGFVLATYGGFPLGFLKNIGNRANNLYPLEWRILKKG